MASLQLGAASLINESWVVFGSSLKLRIGFRNKRLRRVSERWRFRVQQMSVKEQMSRQELARFAKRSESLRHILEKPEENKTSSRLDDLNCEEKHDVVPSSVIDDSKMKTTEELLYLHRQEIYSETVSTAENLAGPNQHNLQHLKHRCFVHFSASCSWVLHCMHNWDATHNNLEKSITMTPKEQGGEPR